LTFILDLDKDNVNHYATYLGQGDFAQRLLSGHRRHTRPT